MLFCIALRCLKLTGSEPEKRSRRNERIVNHGKSSTICVRPKMVIRALGGIAGMFLIAQLFVAQGREAPLTVVAPANSGKTQEEEGQPRKPASSQSILSATRDFQKAVNGKASVRNRCRTRGKDIEIDETTEVVSMDKCKLVIKTVKAPRGSDHANPSSDQPVVEFMIHADLAELTTPVLVETQKFAQCDADGVVVLKVNSRSDPKKPMQVVRRAQSSPTTKPDEAVKQTRRDLSLFFADPVAARKAASALDRAVKACGGKDWPDEDDLP